LAEGAENHMVHSTQDAFNAFPVSAHAETPAWSAESHGCATRVEKKVTGVEGSFWKVIQRRGLITVEAELRNE
jgi:hypothetical protein